MTAVTINIKEEVFDKDNLVNGYYIVKDYRNKIRLVLYNSKIRFYPDSSEKAVIMLDTGNSCLLSNIEFIRKVDNLEINVI